MGRRRGDGDPLQIKSPEPPPTARQRGRFPGPMPRAELSYLDGLPVIATRIIHRRDDHDSSPRSEALATEYLAAKRPAGAGSRPTITSLKPLSSETDRRPSSPAASALRPAALTVTVASEPPSRLAAASLRCRRRHGTVTVAVFEP